MTSPIHAWAWRHPLECLILAKHAGILREKGLVAVYGYDKNDCGMRAGRGEL